MNEGRLTPEPLTLADRVKPRIAGMQGWVYGLTRPSGAANARAMLELGETIDSIVVRDAIAADIPALAELHVTTWNAVNLARVQRDRQEYDEAKRLYTGALAALDSTRASNRVLRLAAQVGLGQVMTARGRGRDAIPILERAVASSVEVSSADHWRTAEARLALGLALVSQTEGSTAEPILRLSVEKLEPQAQTQGKLLALARRALADAQRLAAQ